MATNNMEVLLKQSTQVLKKKKAEKSLLLVIIMIRVNLLNLPFTKYVPLGI